MWMRMDSPRVMVWVRKIVEIVHHAIREVNMTVFHNSVEYHEGG